MTARTGLTRDWAERILLALILGLLIAGAIWGPA
jgi:hypothetical protein